MRSRRHTDSMSGSARVEARRLESLARASLMEEQRSNATELPKETVQNKIPAAREALARAQARFDAIDAEYRRASSDHRAARLSGKEPHEAHSHRERRNTLGETWADANRELTDATRTLIALEGAHDDDWNA